MHYFMLNRQVEMIVKTKLFFATALIILLTAGAVAAVFFHLQQKKMLQAELSETKFISDIIEKSTENLMQKGDGSGLQQVLENVGRNSEIVSLRIVGSDGTIRRSKYRQEIGGKAAEFTGLGGTAASLRQARIHGDVIDYFHEIRNRAECFGCHDRKDAVLGIIQITHDATRSFMPFRSTRRALMLSYALIALIGSALLSYLFSRLLSKRLRNTPPASCPVPERKEPEISAAEDSPAAVGSSFNKVVIQSLVNALEASDRFTRGHSERVRFLSLELGRHAGLDAQELELLEHAAILHDIGKIGIDNFILQKQGKLTTKEYSLIKMHPLIGEEILGPIGTLEEVRKTIIQHHERYDGSGYPHGIRGSEISLKSRILSVVDTFDAMMTDRPYRKALTLEEAKSELRENAGTQFDPPVVDAFLSMLEEKAEELLSAAGYSLACRRLQTVGDMSGTHTDRPSSPLAVHTLSPR
jgi:putative nucleotidyltransferase with HDIG domain